MSNEFSFNDTAIDDALGSIDQSVIDISDSDEEAGKSNGGPIRNNKKSSSSSDVNEFFIRTKDS
jgi:hypothetical protein